VVVLVTEPAPDPVPEVWAALRRRRMTRAFRPDPLDPLLVDGLVDLARRTPSAGNTDGLRVVVLEGPNVVGYWAVALPPARRRAFPWPALLDAPVLLVPCVSAGRYLARYAEADKRRRPSASMPFREGLGRDESSWTVPYWFVDAGMAVMALLAGAEAVGLGALFFGLFEQEAAVRDLLAIPAGWQPLGVVALGRPAEGGSRVSRSAATRPRPPLDEFLHRGRWRSLPAP
jgi:nitroreductase